VIRRRRLRAAILLASLGAASCVTRVVTPTPPPATAPRAVPGDAVDEPALEAASGRTVRVRVGSQPAVLPLEVYVARVLAAEAGAGMPDAAQQALAIAVRTYAVANTGRHRRAGYDLCDTTHCQTLRPSTPVSRRAALATSGQLLTFEGKPADVFYSASCGGRSERASQVWGKALERPYLRSIEDDVHDRDVPWTLEMPLDRIERALRPLGFQGRLRTLRVAERSSSGRVLTLELAGLRPDVVGGEAFRAALGARELRSTAFSVKQIERVARFTGRGYGHGVGLCVVGAGRRAARGETAVQILEQYFPGLALELLRVSSR